MAQKKVIWTKFAAKQLRQVTDYWTEHNYSNSYSIKLIDKIQSNLNGVLKNPKRCPESAVSGIRVSPLGHFSVFYAIVPEGIAIVSFWDNRQDPKKLFEILEKNAG